MSATEGSLACYDAILSVSEEAINRQLKTLYDTKIISPGSAAVVSETEGTDKDKDTPKPVDKYLLSHDLRIRPTEVIQGKEEYSGEGIIGHIECPQISFKDQDPGYVGLSMIFKEEPNIKSVDQFDVDPAELPDEVKKEPAKSWVYYYEGRGRAAKLVCVNVVGWKVSWRAKLASTNIQDVMEELIKPAESDKSPVAATQALVDGMKKVSSDDFLVSSVFCLIEAQDLMDHFKLENKDGHEVEETNQRVTFTGGLSDYFHRMKTKPGIPNPNNPFVLGYGISQKTPSLKSINKDLKTENTPKYFLPKNFRFSTTQGSGLTAGTLNYLMLTHRPMMGDVEEPGRAGTEPGAGVLTKDLFTVTKMRAEHSDAVIGFCRDTFLTRWPMNDMLPKVHVSLDRSFNHFWDGARDILGVVGRSPTYKYKWKNSGAAVVNDASRPTIRYTDDWRTEQENIVDVLAGGCDAWQEGTSETTIEVFSTLADHSNDSVISDDVTRTVTLVVHWRYYVRLMFETWGPAHAGGKYSYFAQKDERLLSNLSLGTSEAYSQKVSFGFRENILLSTKGADAGDWTFDLHQPGSTLPTSAEAFRARLDKSDVGKNIVFNKEDDYVAVGSSGHGAFMPINLNDVLKWFPSFNNVLLGDAVFAMGGMMTRLTSAVNGMQYQVMMPGGEAFFFKGMDIDDQANLYSHLTYRLGASGAARK